MKLNLFSTFGIRKTFLYLMMNLSTIKDNKHGVAVVFGGFLLHLTLGNLYSFGNMMTYMDSYMHLRVDKHVTYSNFIWVNSITTATQGMFMVLAGSLEKKIGVKLTCLVGSLLMSSGIVLTYFSIDASFGAVIFTYGFLNGLGIALTYVLPLACGMEWFPERKGFVSGIIVGGFGLGSLGSTTLQTRFLNPNNIPVAVSGYFEDSSILDRVPNLFLLLGGLFFFMQLISCCLLSKPSSQVTDPVKESTESEQLLEDADNEATEESRVTTVARPVRDLTVKEAVKRREFWLLWFIYFFNTIAVGYINAMYKSFGQTFIQNDFFLSQVGSFAAAFNFCGRIAWGRLMDKTSFRFSMVLMTMCLSSLYFTLPLTSLMGKFSFAIWVWFIFFSFSGTFVLISTATEKAFGSLHYSSIYGLIFTNQVLSALILSFINETMLHRFGYSVCFVTIAVIVLGSTCFTLLLPKRL